MSEPVAPTPAKSRLPVMFASLQFRNYRLWFLGQTVSLMGSWMQNVAQSWLVYSLTGSKIALGTVSFIGALPTFFLMLPAGALVDRLPRRTLMIATQSTMMLLAFAMAILAGTGVLQVWHIALLAVGLGIANSFDAPARQSIAVELVEDRRYLTNAIALNSTMFNLARVVGPALAGILLAAVGAVWCFGLNGLSFIAVIVGLMLMRFPLKPRIATQGGFREQILAGLEYIWADKAIRTMIAMMGTSSLFGMSYAVLMPAYAVDVLHVSEWGLGLLNAAAGLGALLGSLTVASLGSFRHRGMLLTLGSILAPIMVIPFAFSRTFGLSLAILPIIGWAAMVQNSLANTLVQSIVPDHLRGRVMSAYSLVFFGSMPFGSLQAGALAQWLGPSVGVTIGACISLLVALMVVVLVPEVRRQQGI